MVCSVSVCIYVQHIQCVLRKYDFTLNVKPPVSLAINVPSFTMNWDANCMVVVSFSDIKVMLKLSK